MHHTDRYTCLTCGAMLYVRFRSAPPSPLAAARSMPCHVMLNSRLHACVASVRPAAKCYFLWECQRRQRWRRRILRDNVRHVGAPNVLQRTSSGLCFRGVADANLYLYTTCITRQQHFVVGVVPRLCIRFLFPSSLFIRFSVGLYELCAPTPLTV